MTDRDDESRNTVLCTKCNKPTRSGKTGTITQWMVAGCDCELTAVNDDAVVEIDLCSDCGKRINIGRKGSLTQWIFRTDCCTCETTAKPTIAQKVLAARALEEGVEPKVEVDVPQLDDLSPGEFITSSRYKPLSRLGAGASGSVFLCLDTILKRKVALKKLHTMSADTVVDFQNEAQTCSKLKHQNIVSVLDLSADENGVPFMVMEFVDGITLENLLENSGPLTLEQSLPIINEICDALSYAHSLGIMHRDVKSSNILLADSHAYLIDFGIAKFKGLHTDGELKLDTARNTIAGSPLYMPPDQGRGFKYDARSEVYSVGCVLFEVLTGKTPFQGAGALQILSLHAHQAPPALKDVLPDGDFPKQLEDVITKCLEKDPNNRFQSIQELQTSLNEIELPKTSTQVNPISVLTEHTYAQPETAGKTGKSKVAMIWVLLLAAAVGGGMSIRLFVHEKPDAAPAPATVPVERKASDFNELDRQKVIRDAVLKNVTNLKLSSGFIKDTDLDELKGYDKAEEIDLTGDPVTDGGILKISGPRLKRLILTNTDVRTLSFAPRFKNLQSLNLQGTNISDEALKQLRVLRMLRELKLDGTNITNAGLEEITHIPSLELVTVHETKVTPVAVLSVGEKMPMTAIAPGPPKPVYRSRDEISRLQQNRQLKEAIELVDKCIGIVEKAQGKNAVHLTQLLLRRGNLKTQMGDLEGAKYDIERAISIAKLNEHYLNQQTALLALRQFYQSQNKTELANKTERELEHVNNQLLMPESEDTPNRIFEKAETLKNQNKFDEAEILYREYLRMDGVPSTEPRQAWTYAGLGYIALSKHKYPEAQQLLEKAQRLLKTVRISRPIHHARASDLHFELARCYQMQNNWKEAIHTQEEGIRIASEHHLSGRVEQQTQVLAAMKKLATGRRAN